MSAHTEGGTPDQAASSPVNTVHGYLTGVGTGAALLAAAVLAFMALLGMVSFNLWPQGMPRAPAGAAELSTPAQAGAESASGTLAATLVSVGTARGRSRTPELRSARPPRPGRHRSRAPGARRGSATGEDEGGRTSGEGDPGGGGEVFGGAPRGWTQGSGDGYGRGKARGSGGNGKPSSGPTRQGRARSPGDRPAGAGIRPAPRRSAGPLRRARKRPPPGAPARGAQLSESTQY